MTDLERVELAVYRTAENTPERAIRLAFEMLARELLRMHMEKDPDAPAS